MADTPADTIIGANVELKGSIHNHGSIHVHGRVTGDVTSDSQVVIGEGAIVTGPITAKQVSVSGQVQGAITAEHLIELEPKSYVKGDLTTTRLSIKPGAVFVGQSMMAAEESPEPSQYEAPMPASEKKRPRLEVQ
jgi:cytoskeletal protein CcmA (bactofilin family)